MKLSDFDYNLPKALIAQEPMKNRDLSRLLVLNKKSGEMSHQKFYEIVDYLKPGDLIILNNTKVIPARLIGKKERTHGKVEILLHRQIDANVWETLGRSLKVGKKIVFDGSKLEAVPEKKSDETYSVRFNLGGDALLSEIQKIGLPPIPPYVRGGIGTEADRQNYQTVYAKHRGSVAAPTAGLHFTKDLLDKIQKRNIGLGFVTLHVGLGTFAPIKTDSIKEHKMHSEYFEISEELVKRIRGTKKNGGRIIAVGTTSARVLESVSNSNNYENFDGTIRGWTDIFIYPGYSFKCVDAIITNFHLPKSSLLLLVSALAGSVNIKKAYREAIAMEYRFYSYGDAMLIM
jgi:S-adenosylmethionine:tRNA ribosyltransferase-isomerase